MRTACEAVVLLSTRIRGRHRGVRDGVRAKSIADAGCDVVAGLETVPGPDELLQLPPVAHDVPPAPLHVTVVARTISPGNSPTISNAVQIIHATAPRFVSRNIIPSL